MHLPWRKRHAESTTAAGKDTGSTVVGSCEVAWIGAINASAANFQRTGSPRIAQRDGLGRACGAYGHSAEIQAAWNQFDDSTGSIEANDLRAANSIVVDSKGRREVLVHLRLEGDTDAALTQGREVGAAVVRLREAFGTIEDDAADKQVSCARITQVNRLSSA